VRQIISEAIACIPDRQFTVRLVSDEDAVGVIQKRIVSNVYTSDIVVCDVSGRNPNVMFELGMRLAFDKPTVIVKDDKTDYMFDTGIIEHVGYPRDLRYSQIVSFKANLAAKVAATFNAASADPEHSTFLKNFGKFQVATLQQDVVPGDKLVVRMLSDIQEEMADIRRQIVGITRLQRGVATRPAPDRDVRDLGRARMVSAIRQWQSEHGDIPLTPKLIDDPKFLNFVAERAFKFFDSGSDFTQAINAELERAAASTSVVTG
jgi:hypothetical protein